jgi:septum formation protein
VLALRLAVAKAQAGATARPGHVVIGSDQVADLDGAPLGKSGGRDRAIAPLLAMSGRDVDFHTAVCVLVEGESPRIAQDITRVGFRTLDRGEVERYVDAEAPFDCAGSFKCEGLGIALFERIRSDDPTALVGLPLIATAGLLRDAGFRVP